MDLSQLLICIYTYIYRSIHKTGRGFHNSLPYGPPSSMPSLSSLVAFVTDRSIKSPHEFFSFSYIYIYIYLLFFIFEILKQQQEILKSEHGRPQQGSIVSLQYRLVVVGYHLSIYPLAQMKSGDRSLSRVQAVVTESRERQPQAPPRPPKPKVAKQPRQQRT